MLACAGFTKLQLRSLIFGCNLKNATKEVIFASRGDNYDTFN